MLRSIILGYGGLVITAFTYSGLYSNISRGRCMEPDVLGKDGRNVNRSDVCSDTNAYNLGGCMIKRLRCKRGIWPTGFLVVFIITVGMGATGLYKTQKNGVLKNNGKKIWCKMQNKGENFCNAEYPDPA